MKALLKLALVILLQAPVASAGAATIEEGEKLLQAAVATVLASGGEAAAKEFTAGGKWRVGPMYVVMNDLATRVLAHSANPKMVGKVMSEARDPSGKPFVREFMDNIEATGKSHVVLKWANPVTQRFADAQMISTRVPGKPLIVSVVIFQ